MWLKLTQMPNDEPIRINSNLVEAYGLSTENHSNAYLNTNNGSYQVKEDLNTIDNMLIEGKGGWQ